MKTLRQPTNDEGWRRMTSSIIKANLKLAGWNYVDLSAALRKIGVDEPPKNISSKLVRGTSTAVFLLQALSVIGVEQLAIPTTADADPSSLT